MSALKGNLSGLTTLRRLHAMYMTTGTQNPSLWSQLIKDYLSQGCPTDALTIFAHHLPDRTHQPIIASVLKACAYLSLISLGRSVHAESIKAGLDFEVRVGTTLVSMYCKCRKLVEARKVFDGMPEKNEVTYNAMICGYSENGDMGSASILFDQMTSRTPVTWTAMIEGLAGIGDVVAARRVFDDTPQRLKTIVTWTAMVHGYTINGEMDAARRLFDEMPCRNFFAWSSMIAGYFKQGNPKEARVMFEQIPVRNLVNWNALIAGYAQNGCCEEALEAFRRMPGQGFKPDEVTVASALSACAQLGSLDSGKEIHELISRRRIKLNQFVLNGLVDMYAKCGDLQRAKMIFEGMYRRNDVCWNSMISGLASHGRSEEALELFAQMELEEKPNHITFLAVLSACTHGGFLKEGLEIFTMMEKKYGLIAGVEHYGCMVDLFGRAGRLEEAYDLVKKMPMKPNDVVLGALLGACRIHSDTEMADQVVEGLFNPADDAQYVLLSNIYAASDRWEKAEQTRRRMVEAGLQKLPGCSSVMMGLVEHQFHSGAHVESQIFQHYRT